MPGAGYCLWVRRGEAVEQSLVLGPPLPVGGPGVGHGLAEEL